MLDPDSSHRSQAVACSYDTAQESRVVFESIVEFRPAARRDLKSLSGEILPRVARKIDSPADDPRLPGAEKFSGSENSCRAGVGHHRILYEIWDEVLLIAVVRIRHRREAYWRH
jgi:mRNA interferase RelE/StbE